YRRPYTARQTSVSWNLMVGKNPLWVAKQHGHSIATMLRAYAAWAEGTAEVDVEAIKRSMDATETPPTRHLAVNLSVADALRAKRAVTIGTSLRVEFCANRLFRHRKVTAAPTKKKVGWGGRIRTSEWRDQNPLPYHLATPQYLTTSAPPQASAATRARAKRS